MKNRINSMVSVAAICATAFTFGINAQAGERAVITSSTTITPITTLSKRETQSLSLAANRVLYHTEQALLAVADKSKGRALKQINQALKLEKIVRTSSPKYKITTTINASKTHYKSSEDITQRYITVFSDSVLENVITPVMQAKKGGVFHHKSAGVSADQDFSMKDRLVVSLDTMLANRLLHTAKADVKAKKLIAANDALTMIKRKAVIIESVSVPLPLSDAADDLYLANNEMAGRQYHDAYLTLKKASTDLKAYEKISGDVRSKDVRTLTTKIDALTAKVDNLKDKGDIAATMDKAKNDISSWGHDVKGWFKK